MQVTKPRGVVSLGILLLSTFSLVGCKDIELKSTWLDREINIDGKQDDWENFLMFIKDKMLNKITARMGIMTLTTVMVVIWGVIVVRLKLARPLPMVVAPLAKALPML